MNPSLIKRLIAILLAAGSFALFCWIPKWATVAGWMNGVLEEQRWHLILAAALIAGLLRRGLLGVPARFVTSFLIYALTYFAIFQSRWLPPYVQPTFLFYLTWFHLVLLFLMIGLDDFQPADLRFIVTKNLQQHFAAGAGRKQDIVNIEQ